MALPITESSGRRGLETRQMRQKCRSQKVAGQVQGRIEISPETVQELAARFYNVGQVAAALGVSRDTLERRLKEPEFQICFERGRGLGEAEIIDLQMKAARAGDVRMLIHLGRVYLGQKDTCQTQLTGPDGGPPKIEIVRVVFREPRAIPADAEPSNGHS
jgi:hypothetical protein